MSEVSDSDVTRRTRLAAERTWLAWWRTGIAASATAVGIGGVVPQLVGSQHTPYVVLGAAYAVLAVAIFVVSGRRQRDVERSLDRGGYADLQPHWVTGFTVAGSVLAVGTLAAIIVSS